MWLLTAVGPVHGQSKFTFVLEQKKEYSVGRDPSSDIRFESKQVRPKEGTLVVDDWDPRQPRTPPSLRWRTEPKKNGTYGTYKTLGLLDSDNVGSTDKDDYEVTEMKEGAGGHGCFLENGSEGILFTDDNWFITEWRDLSLQYDKMKDESDDVRDVLRRYCLSWTQTFDTADRPNYVLSTSLRSNVDCNYAVCFGIRILLPSFLEALVGRLNACWKSVADSQDSFSLPDEEDGRFQPDIDSGIQAARKELRTWLPNSKRETLFSGWKILGLRGKTQPAEKRFLIAMGADYQDIDVLSRPLESKEDFIGRIDPWLKHLDDIGGREQAMIVWFVPVKAELTKRGLNFTQAVGGTCHRLGLYFAHGGVLWGSVSYEGPKEYCSALASNIDHGNSTAGPSKTSTAGKNSVALEPPKQTQITPAQTSSSYQSEQSHAPDFIPSTFPEETRTTNARSPSPVPTSKPVRRTRQTTSPLKEKSPELFPETASASAVKKPLRRRANKGAVTFSQLPEDYPVSEEHTPDNSQGSQPHPSFVQDSQSLEETQRPLFASQRMEIDSIAPSQPATQGSVRRLKRRAGGATPSLIQEIADTSIDVERDIKAEETAAEIRELYEQTGTSSFDSRALKRARLAPGGAIAELAESSLRDRPSRLRRTQEQRPVDTDHHDSASTSASSRIGAREPPTGQRMRGNRSPSEEQEEVESHSTSKSRTAAKAELISPVKPKKKGASSTQPSKDEEFLKAISKASKAKKAIDELDREFNQLRIPKPNGKTAVVKANEWEAAQPDWDLLNDFDDDMRGNFIQIVRKDLFRKDKDPDAIRDEAERVDDGRPNFKKFKKKNIVRRDPLGLVLAGPTAQDAEMGEPYWPTQVVRGGNNRNQSQVAQAEEDDMPLLPRSRKRLLGTQAVTQDDAPSTSRATQKRGRVSDTQQTQTPSAAGSQVRRKARAESVLSEADSVGTSISAATSTRGARRNTGTTTSASASASARGMRGRGKQSIVLEDSEEEDEGVDWRGASTNSASAKLRSGRTATGTGTVTLDDDNAPARGRRSQLPKSTGTSVSASAATGRRKLLPADDEDGMGFRGLGKKRRLG